MTVTGPGGEKVSNKRSGVHPNTNYDESVSRGHTPENSDSEELGDIRHAQSLNIYSSAIDSSVPHRVIRTIIRGDFPRMQREAENGTRRLRTYLVATDLSGEAAYALEWTIGTVLRDGDTLLAVYAVDEEAGTGKGGDTESIQSLAIGEGAKSIQDTTAMIEKMTLLSQHTPSTSASPSPLVGSSLKAASRNDSSAGSTDSRYLSKSEQERLHAIEGISQTCIKFLRKTKLQVRIAVEVIHCKSPKYMITEAVSPFVKNLNSCLLIRPNRLTVWSLLSSFSVLVVGALSKGMYDYFFALLHILKTQKRGKTANICFCSVSFLAPFPITWLPNLPCQ